MTKTDEERAHKAVQTLGALLSRKPHSREPNLSERYFEWVQSVERAHAEIRDALAARPAAPAEGEGEPQILDEESLRARIGEAGNQIHNLGCEYQNVEGLTDRLSEIRASLWELAQKAPIYARPDHAVARLTAELAAMRRRAVTAETDAKINREFMEVSDKRWAECKAALAAKDAEIARAVEALEPFANFAETWPNGPSEEKKLSMQRDAFDCLHVTVADFHRAKTALAVLLSRAIPSEGEKG